MILHALVLATACVALETTEQVMYRFSGLSSRGRWGRMRFIGPAIAAHIGRLVLWYLLLKVLPLGEAIPLLGVNYLSVAIAGRLLFHESIDARRWLGTGLVVAGFLLVAVHLQ